jgi:MoaA/NifB/PqqE/SkfB family radical SAM enzyme
MGLYQFDGNFMKKPLQPCIAGHNTCLVNIDGSITPCHLVKRKIGSLYSDIVWSDELMNCNVECCSCPFFYYQAELLDVALKNVLKTTNARA